MPLSAPLHKLKTNWASEIPNWKRITLLATAFRGVIQTISRLMAWEVIFLETIRGSVIAAQADAASDQQNSSVGPGHARTQARCATSLRHRRRVASHPLAILV